VGKNCRFLEKALQSVLVRADNGHQKYTNFCSKEVSVACPRLGTGVAKPMPRMADDLQLRNRTGDTTRLVAALELTAQAQEKDPSYNAHAISCGVLRELIAASTRVSIASRNNRLRAAEIFCLHATAVLAVATANQ
jgi:hypothetical protein